MAPGLALEAPRGRAAISPAEIHDRKLALASGGKIPSNVEWYASLSDAERGRLSGSVRRKPTRTLSGVAVVAVMTAPSACPHGRCTYCPGGVEFGTPQSYTGEEPSALRGAQFGWDARTITEHRLSVLDTIGHPTSKVEVILMGGTFPARPKAYRDAVVRGVLDGLNGTPSASLSDAASANERSAHRLVGLTVETRPDWCDGRILPDLLDAGVTRVEIGVECLTEEVLERVHRAHGVGDVARATREARDRGLKVAYHLMLGLPGMDPSRDLQDARRIFSDPQFRPDMLKIYPTLVIPGTGLHEEWKAGRYAPYDTATAATLLAHIKRELPPWVRVQRIQRDIPARLIASGVRTSNLRQVAHRKLAEMGGRCRCLRCREAGRRASPPAERFVLGSIRYPAGDGVEEFLSFEDPESDTVAGFLRLRFPSEATSGGLEAPVIRELKVLGAEVDIGRRPGSPSAYQHHGFGRALVDRAEESARASGHARLYVLSAIGTREYYRKLGFERAGPHMAKPLFA
ncbi:MAG TPA: tRNA uridine(34) 5-carboxymethylaminomethyl modification radical SAM/GNAT enzyme Elp3 [Thermoplasmata archaeon]|nr:tRNA uridine(34) 5-carboxymethylaminomethyl modification radical SAM/GNAT enzyme Elp3 [Thermoplasmata archaeon]